MSNSRENIVKIVGLGTGGTNMVSSVRRIITNDIEVMLASKHLYAEIAKDAFGYISGDTNHGALRRLPKHEQLPLGKSGGGSKRDPQYVVDSFMAALPVLTEKLGGSQVVPVIATGGKNTGLNTLHPCCRAVRDMKKLVIPIFALPSSDQGEITEEKHERCLRLINEMIADGFRVIVVLNDRSYKIPGLYDETYEKLNLQFAKGLRGTLWGIVEGLQLDESDYSIIWAGGGYSRLAHIDLPRDFEKGEGLNKRIAAAVDMCFENQFYGFPENAQLGECIMCIQGDWQRSTFGEMRHSLTRKYNEKRANKDLAASIIDSRNIAEPWGMTLVLNEFTGLDHAPLDLDWSDKPMLVDMMEEIRERTGADAVPVSTAPAAIVVDTLNLTIADLPDTPTSSPELPTSSLVLAVSNHGSNGGDRKEQTPTPVRVPVPVWPTTFQKLISRMNSDDEVCLAEAKTGQLEGKVTLSVDEVVEWVGLHLFRILVKADKFSQENQDWIYAYLLESSREFDSTFTAKLPNHAKAQLNRITEAQLQAMEVRDGDHTPNQTRWLRAVKMIYDLWGYDKAEALLKGHRVSASHKREAASGAIASEPVN